MPLTSLITIELYIKNVRNKPVLVPIYTKKPTKPRAYHIYRLLTPKSEILRFLNTRYSYTILRFSEDGNSTRALEFNSKEHTRPSIRTGGTFFLYIQLDMIPTFYPPCTSTIDGARIRWPEETGCDNSSPCNKSDANNEEYQCQAMQELGKSHNANVIMEAFCNDKELVTRTRQTLCRYHEQIFQWSGYSTVEAYEH